MGWIGAGSHTVTFTKAEVVGGLVPWLSGAEIIEVADGFKITGRVTSVVLTGRFGEGGGMDTLPAGGAVFTRLTLDVGGFGKVELERPGIIDVQCDDWVTVRTGKTFCEVEKHGG